MRPSILTGYQRRQFVVVLLGLLSALAFFGVLWVQARGAFAGGTTVYFVAPSALGVQPGEPVRLSGFRIGEVYDMDLRADATVLVALNLDRRYLRFVHADSVASIESESMLGENYIAISPGSPGAAPLGDKASLVFRVDDPMQALAQLPQQLAQTLQHIDILADTLSSPSASLQQGLAQVAQLAAELRGTRRNLDLAIGDVHHLAGRDVPRTLAQVDEALRQAKASLAKADAVFDTLGGESKATLEAYRQAATEAQARLAAVDALLSHSQDLVEDSDQSVKSLRHHWPFDHAPDPPPEAIKTAPAPTGKTPP